MSSCKLGASQDVLEVLFFSNSSTNQNVVNACKTLSLTLLSLHGFLDPFFPLFFWDTVSFLSSVDIFQGLLGSLTLHLEFL